LSDFSQNVFGKAMGQNNIFGGIFGRNFGRPATNEISKVGKM